MKMLVVKHKDWYVNIPVAKISFEGGILTAWNQTEEPVGMFDIGSIDAWWISEKKEGM